MTGIRSTDLHQIIRDMIDTPTTDGQVAEIAARAYGYDGTHFQQVVTTDEFWTIVEEVIG